MLKLRGRPPTYTLTLLVTILMLNSALELSSFISLKLQNLTSVLTAVIVEIVSIDFTKSSDEVKILYITQVTEWLTSKSVH